MKKILRRFGILTSLFISITGLSQTDDCSSAPQLFPTLTTCVYQNGSSANATQSLSGCSGNADDDVWFYFIANSSEMTVKVDPTAGYDAVFELFDGSCSGSSLGCRDVNPVGINEKYSYSGLTIGNTYYLRIYDFRSGSGTSTFRVCVSGLAPANNTTPCSAYVLPAVEPACNFQTYLVSNHAGSSIPTPTTCGGSAPHQGGYTGGDMWFKVVVPSSGNVEISTVSIDFGDGAMALYSGASCSSLTQVACDDDRGGTGASRLMPYIYSTGNTPGDTMFIRVWEYGNDTQGKFKICVSTPDNDDCPNALQICDINGYGGTTSPQYSIDRPGNMAGKDEIPAGPFGNGYTGSSPVQIDNNSWITFQAAATTASFTVEIEDCLNNRGLQMQIFSGANCDNFSEVSNFLETTTSQILTASGLTIGNTYYIMIDGFSGDVCSYTVSANSGVQVVQVSASDTTICDGSTVTVNAQVFGTGSYTYNWYSIPAGGPYPSTASFTATPSVTTEYFVDITGLCGNVTTSSLKIFVNPIPTAPTVSASASPICPNGSSTITASGTPGATYAVYNAASGGTLLGYTPYVFNANGFVGTTTFYVETISSDSCVSNSRSSISVVSQDNSGPSVSCPPNQVVNVDANCQAILNDYIPLVTANDNCYSAVTNITQSPVAGTLLSGHNTNQVVTITATDSLGNSSQCTFVVNLQDRIDPVITCMNDTIVHVDSNCEYTVPDYLPSISGTDNCTAPNNLIFTQTPLPGAVLSGVGTIQQIRIIVTDGANNMDTCDFDITLEDVTPATLNCPADQNDTIITEGCQYTVQDYTGFANLASDNCSNTGGGANITQVPAPGSIIDLSVADQSFVVTLTYTDGSNNSSSCSFNVNAVCLREVEIPQFFSPNGDGLNDIFEIRNLVIYPQNMFKVFNRFGNIVYEMKNYDNSWDGRTNTDGIQIGSNVLPSATYFYILEIEGQDDKTGYLHLKR